MRFVSTARVYQSCKGIGVYGYLESYEGREHRFLEVCLAAGGEPHPIGSDEVHDEGGILAFDHSYFF